MNSLNPARNDRSQMSSYFLLGLRMKKNKMITSVDLSRHACIHARKPHSTILLSSSCESCDTMLRIAPMPEPSVRPSGPVQREDATGEALASLDLSFDEATWACAPSDFFVKCATPLSISFITDI
jgi:hypothetical protein